MLEATVLSMSSLAQKVVMAVASMDGINRAFQSYSPFMRRFTIVFLISLRQHKT